MSPLPPPCSLEVGGICLEDPKGEPVELECIGEVGDEKEKREKMILLSCLKFSGLIVVLCMHGSTPNNDFEN